MFVSCASMEVVLFSAIVGELRFKLLLTRFVAFQKIEIGDFSLICGRGCPKVYHPACVKRTEAFFRSRSKWNCGKLV